MQQNFFQFFLPQEAWAFENNIEKEPQKPRPKLKKLYALYIFTENICSIYSPKDVVCFCKNVIIL